MLKKNILIKIFETLLTLSIILDLNSVYCILLRMSSNLRVSFFSIIFLILLMIIRGKKIKIMVNQSIFLLIYIFGLIFINYFLNVSGLKTVFIYYFFIFFLFYIYFSTYGKTAILSILDKFIKIVVILSIISLFFWILGDCLNIIKGTHTVYIDFGAGTEEVRGITSYYNLHFDTQKIIINGLELIRNSGIFCEAPMFAIIILVAMMFQLFIKEIRFSKFNLIILTITVLTTTSTTGILFSIIMLFVYLEINQVKIKLLNQLKYILFPLVFCIVFLLSLNIIDNKSSTDSYSNRLLDYKNSFSVFMHYPFLGKGISHEHYYEGHILGYGYSNTISKIITDGGMYLLLFYLVGVIKVVKYGIYKKNNNIIAIAIMCCLFSIFIIFAHYTLSIFLISIAYAINKKGIGEKKENEV